MWWIKKKEVAKENKYAHWNTCFLKKNVGNYDLYSSESRQWIEFKEIKYSGRTIEIEDCKILYECLVPKDFDRVILVCSDTVMHEVKWISKESLKFPK
jgi:Leu/Phe-tRNA-protein transferase